MQLSHLSWVKCSTHYHARWGCASPGPGGSCRLAKDVALDLSGAQALGRRCTGPERVGDFGSWMVPRSLRRGSWAGVWIGRAVTRANS